MKHFPKMYLPDRALAPEGCERILLSHSLANHAILLLFIQHFTVARYFRGKNIPC